jgi:hypothetical protein
VDGTVEARIGPRVVDCGPRGLAILDVFAYPKTLDDGLGDLGDQVAGAHDWMQLTAAIQTLYDAGVLVDQDHSSPAKLARPATFDQAVVHVRMLDDRARTAALIQGIRETVRAGDVVVEIGTGTGVLATAAAQAGAKRVYAIEHGRIADRAREVVAANGVADIVTVVEGWSTQVDLPERGDVFVSEILGDEALGELVVEFTLDARRRLLKPNARHVLGRLQMFAVPVAIPEEDLGREVFTERNTSRWREWYDIDFAPLVRSELDLLFVHPDAAAGWTALAEPVGLTDFNLATVDTFDVTETVRAQATASGSANGVYVFFEVQAGETGLLSNRPGFDPHPSWRLPLWRFAEPAELHAGEPFRVTYERGGLGRNDLVTLATG